MKIITKNKSLFFILIFTLSNLFGTEIWEKEIPPSRYLENFAKNSEQENEKGLKNVSYALFIINEHTPGIRCDIFHYIET